MIVVKVRMLKTRELFEIRCWKLDLSNYTRAEIVKHNLSRTILEYSDYEIVEVIGI